MARNTPKNNNAFSLNPESFKAPAQEVHDVQEIHDVQELPRVEFGATQGRKGFKAKRINMAFSDENHEWIKVRSRQLGISATTFVNMILDEKRVSQ